MIQWLSLLEIDTTNLVQILDEVLYISQSTNTLGKRWYLNISLLLWGYII